MPYIYIWVFVSSTNSSTNLSYEMINETLQDMLDSQANFNTSLSIAYVSPDLQTWTTLDTLYSEYAGIVFHDWFTNDTFVSYFKIRFSNPDPALGSFQFQMFLDTYALTLNETINIAGVWVSVSRDTTASLANVAYLPANEAFGENATLSYVVDYSEEVHFGWKDSEPSHYFETELAYEEDVIEGHVDSGGMYIAFRVPPTVEHWVEYVDFSYYDCFFALGGTLSIITVCFFFVAHRIAKALGDSLSIGILPGMSISFRNLEMLSWLKSQLDRKNGLNV